MEKKNKNKNHAACTHAQPAPAESTGRRQPLQRDPKNFGSIWAAAPVLSSPGHKDQHPRDPGTCQTSEKTRQDKTPLVFLLSAETNGELTVSTLRSVTRLSPWLPWCPSALCCHRCPSLCTCTCKIPLMRSLFS